MNKIEPMDCYTFLNYMTRIQKEIEWIDKCYEVGLDTFMEHIQTVDTSIELLEYIFNDTEDYIGIFIFEDNFGKGNFHRLIHNDKYVKTTSDLWELLIDNYNNKEARIGVRYV